MALSQRQHKVLFDMGIPVWERRCQDVPTESETEQFFAEAAIVEEVVKAKADTKVILQGRCILVMPSLSLSQSEQSLLAAMLRTVSLLTEQVDLIDESAFQLLEPDSLESKVIWFLGCEAQTDKRYVSLSSDSLRALLTEPKRKAIAWEALKQLAIHMR
jgi:DNA polymerase III psi subunit